MAMTPMASHVSIRPSVIQPLVHPQHAGIDRYIDESIFGNRPINSDVPLFGGVPLQILERLVQESPRDYSGKLPGVVPKENTV